MPLATPIKQLTSLDFWNLGKPSKKRRFAYLPELFLIMALVTMGYSLYTMKQHEHMEEMVRFTTWHLQLRKEYVLGLYRETQALPTQTTPLLRQLQHNLGIMLNGGTITLPGDPEPIHVHKATDPTLKQELQRRIRIYQKIQSSEAKLRQTKSQSEAYRAIWQSINTLLSQLEYPHDELVTLYVRELHQSSQQLTWLELSTVLLIALVGVIMTQQQKKTLQDLAESDQRFREIFRLSPVGKLLVTLDGKIQGVNQSLQNMLGYSEAELLQQPLTLIFGDELTEEEKKLHQDLASQKISSYEIEKRLRHRDGHAIWVIVSGTLMYDVAQKTKLIVLQAQNITNLRNIQDALQVSERRYRTIFESARDGIMAADMGSNIVSANAQVHQILGYGPDELIGKSLLNIIPPIYREAHLKGMQHVKETHHSSLSGKLLELQGLKQNGETFPLELSLSTWEGGEDTMMATAIIRDITVRKEFQRDRDALILSKKA